MRRLSPRLTFALLQAVVSRGDRRLMDASHLRLTFALLQAVVFAIGGGGPYLSFPLTILVLWPGTMVAGVVLAVKGFARGNRSGLGENRFVGVLVLALAGFSFS